MSQITWGLYFKNNFNRTGQADLTNEKIGSLVKLDSDEQQIFP